VIGITTAWGDTRSRTLLVRRLLSTLGVRTYRLPRDRQLRTKTPFTQKKWASGATDTTPAPDAIEFIQEQVRKRPGEITLIALAPLSNIEALQRRDPQAIRKLRQVVIDGWLDLRRVQPGRSHTRSPASPRIQTSSAHRVACAVLLESGVAVKMFHARLDADQVRRSPARPSVRLRITCIGCVGAAVSPMAALQQLGTAYTDVI